MAQVGMDMAAMNEMSRASALKCLLGESEWKPAEKRRRRRRRRREGEPETAETHGGGHRVRHNR